MSGAVEEKADQNNTNGYDTNKRDQERQFDDAFQHDRGNARRGQFLVRELGSER